MVAGADLDLLVVELEKWIKSQPHLPQATEKIVLKRFLHSMFADLDGAKRLFKLNYTLRNKYPQYFLDRDPCDENSQKLLQVAYTVPLPGLTPEKSKLLFYRLRDYDADKFSFVDGVKVFFMVADCRFVVEDDAVMSEGDIPIFDMAGYTLRHLRKTVFSALRVYMKFVQEAHPVRLKEIHVLNCPSYLDKVLTVVKPFIKSEVFKLIHFHLPNAETPYKYIPKDMLPDEYGGKAGKMSTLQEQWVKILQDKREYLMDPNCWKIDKSKKISKKANDSNNKSICVNLKALEID